MSFHKRVCSSIRHRWCLVYRVVSCSVVGTVYLHCVVCTDTECSFKCEDSVNALTFILYKSYFSKQCSFTCSHKPIYMFYTCTRWGDVLLKTKVCSTVNVHIAYVNCHCIQLIIIDQALQIELFSVVFVCCSYTTTRENSQFEIRKKYA